MALDKRHHVHQSRHSSQRCDYLSKYPFRVCADTSFARVVQVGAVKAADSESKDELKEADEGVDDEEYETALVGGGAFLPGHLGGRRLIVKKLSELGD